jgi:hypothetical protein
MGAWEALGISKDFGDVGGHGSLWRATVARGKGGAEGPKRSKRPKGKSESQVAAGGCGWPRGAQGAKRGIWGPGGPWGLQRVTGDWIFTMSVAFIGNTKYLGPLKST